MVHCVFEKDRSQNAVASKTGAGDDASTHLVNPVEHLLVAGIVGLADSIKAQRLGGATPALIKGGDETVLVLDLFKLLVKSHKPFRK